MKRYYLAEMFRDEKAREILCAGFDVVAIRHRPMWGEATGRTSAQLGCLACNKTMNLNARLTTLRRHQAEHATKTATRAARKTVADPKQERLI